MITLTRIDGTKVMVNAEEIETIETQHDTIITLKSGRKIVVRNTDDEIRQLTIEYKKEIYSKKL